MTRREGLGGLGVVSVLLAVIGHQPNHGSVQCESCRRWTPAISAEGSYYCACGDALYVEPAPVGDQSRNST